MLIYNSIDLIFEVLDTTEFYSDLGFLWGVFEDLEFGFLIVFFVLDILETSFFNPFF